jgi:AraC-like DNA-binding protein
MTSTITLDVIRLWISLLVIGQQLLIALVFLKDKPREKAQWLGSLLLFGAMAYLVQSNPVLRSALSAIWPITAALALAVPYLLWEFSIAIFEIRSVPAFVRYPVYTVPILAWVVIVTDLANSATFLMASEVSHHVVSLALITHIVISVYSDRRDDLLEPRRRYRAMFILFIGLQAGAVLIVELIFGFGNVPGWIEMTNVIMIALLTLGLMYPLLRVDGEILWHEGPRTDDAEPVTLPDNLSPADRVLHTTLTDAMNAGLYRTTSLGISELAEDLKVPEHQLRKLINRHLGYRNFSSFLNVHRVDEAKLRLAKAEDVRIPVLTIAMDLGYGSIGPFNRAFKEATGMTPTDFRNQKLGKSLADTE